MNTNNKKIVSLLAKRLDLKLSSMQMVNSAHKSVFSNNAIYLKISNLQEIEIFKKIYRNNFIDSVIIGDDCAIATKNTGTAIKENEMNGRQFSAWMREIKNLWNSNIPQQNIPKLDTAREITLIYERTKTDKFNIGPLIYSLLCDNKPTTTYNPKKESLLHGDPNFRNVTFNNSGEVNLIDFDHACIGPVEWDIANILIVCLIANRHDLYSQCLDEFKLSTNSDLLNYFVKIRLAQTLAHTAVHLDFETESGLNQRIKIARTILNHGI